MYGRMVSGKLPEILSNEFKKKVTFLNFLNEYVYFKKVSIHIINRYEITNTGSFFFYCNECIDPFRERLTNNIYTAFIIH